MNGPCLTGSLALLSCEYFSFNEPLFLEELEHSGRIFLSEGLFVTIGSFKGETMPFSGR